MITDLLFGVTSVAGNSKHFFFADLDTSCYDEVLCKCMLLLNHVDYVIIVNSGKGYHVLNFQKHDFDKYVYLLELVGADENYVRWVKKVGYGVLRISRRSSHFKVPRFEGMFKKRGYVFDRDEVKKILLYLSLIELESEVEHVIRVVVDDRKSGC